MKTLALLLAMSTAVAADNAPFHVSHPDCDTSAPLCWYTAGEKQKPNPGWYEMDNILSSAEGFPL